MSVVKQAWEKEGCGLFLYAAFGIILLGAAYETFFKKEENPGRAKAVRKFEMECVDGELGGRSWEYTSKWDREEIATRCANLSRRFRLEYGK
jgi:hypothetical protein